MPLAPLTATIKGAVQLHWIIPETTTLLSSLSSRTHHFWGLSWSTNDPVSSIRIDRSTLRSLFIIHSSDSLGTHTLVVGWSMLTVDCFFESVSPTSSKVSKKLYVRLDYTLYPFVRGQFEHTDSFALLVMKG